VLKRGELHAWSINLDGLDPEALPPPTAEERDRGARFQVPGLGERYLRSHAALRKILARFADGRMGFAVTENGKPYLPAAPEIQFNLSHSKGRAMVGVALQVPVGVDVERIRPMPDSLELARRFFPPSEAEALEGTPPADREREFFRRWTRFEAMLKARGIGLHGAGAEVGGEWSVFEIASGVEYAAAAAVESPDMELILHREFE
jgi:4'-phosphopantetheinyl transferase